MSFGIVLVAVAVAALLSLLFSTLTYSLRDFSRSRLETALERRNKLEYLEPTVDHTSDLIFVTAVGRLFSNILILIGVLHLLNFTHYSLGTKYLLAVVITAVIHLFFSVAIPHAISRHAAEPMIAVSIRFLHGLRLAMLPITKLMHGVDMLVSHAATKSSPQEQEEIEEAIENEILSAVEEGEKEGVVDEEERQMIESVIAFHDTQVGQIMTPRPEIFALEIGATLEQVKATIAESGHSRIPVYQGKIDQIVGILYARDMLKLLGEPADKFNIRDFIRPAFFVPETKPLRDLLHDFRLQKVHIAIVSDEYGGTAGLVTIEDIFEELVGDISDEHEPAEPAMIQRIDDLTAEADARTYIDELNRVLGLNLPEDAGYDTLGGFISTTLGKIPEPGTTFEGKGAKFTVLDAEPQKVNRVRVELVPEP
ncbi:MAG: magnesium and cobalt exporter, family, partial [Humisphaera sp.]|nr:magnesium and cobalt exporter, family [Humisphaera sp.]